MKPGHRTIVVSCISACLALSVNSAQGCDLSAVAEIGPDGGTLEIPGYVKALVPPGALTSTTQFQVRQVHTPHGNPATIFPAEILPPAFEFTPNVAFAKLAEVRLYCGDRCPPLGMDGGWPVEIGLVNPQGHVQVEYGLGGGNPNSEGVPYVLNYEEGYVAVRLDYWAGTRMLLSTSGVRKRVGPAGGTLELPGFRAVIPPNALSEDIELRVRAVKAPAGLKQNADGDLVGPVYEFTPELQFSEPVEVRLWFRWEWMPKRINPLKRRQYFPALKSVEIDATAAQLPRSTQEQFHGNTSSRETEPYVEVRLQHWKGLRSIYLPADASSTQ